MWNELENDRNRWWINVNGTENDDEQTYMTDSKVIIFYTFTRTFEKDKIILLLFILFFNVWFAIYTR